MTSISTSAPPAPPAPSPTEHAGAEGTGAATNKGESGFMALIEALLQGATPGESAVVELVAGDKAATEDSGEEGDPAADLLYGLGLPSLPLPQSQPPANTEAGGGRMNVGRSNPQLPGLGLVTATPGDAAGGEAAEDAASALSADALLGALGEEGGETAPARSDAPTTGLGTWAATAQRIAQAAEAAPRTPAADASLRETVGTPRWREELGARLTLMAVGGQQSGSLRLSPEHLGPIEIQIDVAEDKTTSVQFGAQHAETRAALQDALPRLRELFATAGLQLGDAGVSGQAPRQRPADEAGFDGRSHESHGDGEPSPVQRSVRSITHSGLLDTYA